MDNNYMITVVVLTFNSNSTIDQCLCSILNQKYNSGKIEVIVIDNGSSDNTLSIIKQRGVRYVVVPELKIPTLRNEGLRLAQAPLVGFIDSDCVVESDWVENAIKCFENSKIAVAGYKYHLPPSPTFFELTWYSLPERSVGKNELIPAGNMILKKKPIVSIGGFNEALPTGEDSDLLCRVRESGQIVLLNDKIINYHYGNAKSLKQFYLKELWYGMGVDFFDALRCCDKPMCMSLIFLLSLFSSVVCLLLQYWLLVPIFLVVAFLTCVAAAVHRKYIKKRGGNVAFLVIVYAVYFAARAHSLLYIFKLKQYRNVKNVDLG